MNRVRTIAERLRDYSDQSGGANACWPWIRSIGSGGYGHVRVNRRTMLAHRVSWELTNGAVPEGLVLDHLCRNRACINPAHLEPVTMRENIRRGHHPNVLAKLAGRCTSGHELNPENTMPNGFCRACHLRRSKAFYRSLTEKFSDAERPMVRARGVTWDVSRQRFRVEIMHAGRVYRAGRFADFEDAVRAAESLRNTLTGRTR